jgi:uncharacterized membrane protein
VSDYFIWRILATWQGIKKVLMRDIILCLLHIAKTYFMPKSYGYLEKKTKVMVKKIWISDFGFRIL